MSQADISKVRSTLFHYKGSRVKIRANKGRQRYDVNEGIIKEVYPYVFMLEITDQAEEAARVVSYTYSDLLTRDVQLKLCET